MLAKEFRSEGSRVREASGLDRSFDERAVVSTIERKFGGRAKGVKRQTDRLSLEIDCSGNHGSGDYVFDESLKIIYVPKEGSDYTLYIPARQIDKKSAAYLSTYFDKESDTYYSRIGMPIKAFGLEQITITVNLYKPEND